MGGITGQKSIRDKQRTSGRSRDTLEINKGYQGMPLKILQSLLSSRNDHELLINNHCKWKK